MLFALLGACSEPSGLPPEVWNGEHVRYLSSQDEQAACAGTWSHLDDLVAHLGATFGVANPSVVYVWLPDGTAELCGTDLAGCALGNMAVSRHPLMQHEIVHAVRDPASLYLPLEEGFAEAFGDPWTATNPAEFSADDLTSLLESAPAAGDLDQRAYARLGHYVAYLREQRGVAALESLGDGTEADEDAAAAEAGFIQSFGMTFAESVSEYSMSYPLWYSDESVACDRRVYRDTAFECGRDPVGVSPDADVAFGLSLSCDDPSTIGARDGSRWRTVTLEVSRDGLYDIDVLPSDPAAADVLVRRCGGGCTDPEAFAVQGAAIRTRRCLRQGNYLLRVAASDTGDEAVAASVVVGYVGPGSSACAG